MPYIVLALGMLVSAIGAYAMYSGFRIVEIERGWATAIVGSVLFSGGLVTAVTGLAIRTLDKVQRLLRTERTALVPAAEPVRQTISAVPDTSAPRGIENVGAEAASVAAAVIATETLQPAARSSRSTETDRPPYKEQGLISPDMVGAILAGDETHRERPESVDDEWRSSDELPPTYPSPHTDDREATPKRSEAITAAADDQVIDSWLEDGVAELDDTTPAGAVGEAEVATAGADSNLLTDDRRHEPGANDMPHVDAEPLAVPLEPEPDPEPVADLARPASPKPNAPQTAVIGRYESDGTSYVMYADGSIEAQSDAGVYRFASMAELKAFIEG